MTSIGQSAGPRRVGRRAASAVLTLVLACGLAACSGDPLADQYRAGDNKGYIAGNSVIDEIAATDRDESVLFSGTTDAGDTVSNSDYAGRVLVVNFWYAGCAPCRQEAPQLEQALGEFTGQDVSFLGVNLYDQAATAQSFARQFDVSYPTVIDVNDKAVTQAFAKAIPVNATPTTLVIDKQGRVAARIIGELPSASILTALVRTALAEAS